MNRNILGILALASMMESCQDSEVYKELPINKPKPKSYSKTKGYKNYSFDEHGNWDVESLRKNEIVFRCVAKTDRQAKEKFIEFKNQK